MVLDWLGRIVLRDLGAIAAQVEAYPDEDDIWKLVPGISNSAGTFALHLAGNLQAYFGAQLGDTGYVRDRDAEFATRDVPRQELLRQLHDAQDAVRTTLAKIRDEDLDAEYPIEVGGVRLRTGLFLLHLATHLSYHLGQMDYHRRFVTGEGSLPGMQSIPALISNDE